MDKIMIGSTEGSIYPDGNGYRGAIDLGFDAKGRRQRVKGKPDETQRKDKLKEDGPTWKRRSQRREDGRRRRERFPGQGTQGTCHKQLSTITARSQPTT